MGRVAAVGDYTRIANMSDLRNCDTAQLREGSPVASA